MRLNTPKIKLRLGVNAGGKVQQYAVKRAKDYMDKYVPYRDGFLRANVELGNDYVLYKSPYAHYQYKGIMYLDPTIMKGSYYSEDYGHWTTPGITKIPSGKSLEYHTPGTGSYWDKRMMSAEGHKLIKEIEEYMKR